MTYYPIISVLGTILTYEGGEWDAETLPDDFSIETYRISVEDDDISFISLSDITQYTISDYTVVVNDEDGTTTIKRSDGACIPVATGNRDYREFLIVDGVEYCVREHHPTTDEKWASIGARRDGLLTKCDWTQATDSPLDDATKLLWQTYRQALRDIPNTYSSPDDIVWPTEPYEV